LSNCSCGLDVNVGPGDGIRATAEGVGVTAVGETAGVVAFTESVFAGDAIDAQGNPTTGSFAGNFNGPVNITGQLTKSSGSFKIDHPLDPANKYLYHSFVESPDMMNIYNGNVILDGKGEAQVELPNWFSTLNRDFRYQLTSIGAPANLYIAEEISGNRFKVAGGKPGGKVSWQVTGIRQDAWANAHRIPVEQEKEQKEKGFYIHPELYGAPEQTNIEWARRPKVMQKIEDAKARQRLRAFRAQ
jgi:hypothetical protein